MGGRGASTRVGTPQPHNGHNGQILGTNVNNLDFFERGSG